MSRFLLLFISFFLSVVNAQETIRLPPVDDGGRDLSFVEYRQQILGAVKQRNSKALTEFISEQVYSGQDRKRGLRHFAKVYEPEAANSEIWSIMEQVLTMGGGFVRSESGVKFCAPYVFTDFPDDLDIYGHGVIIGNNVPLKRKPLSTAKEIVSLSYDILMVEDWRSIEETDGEQKISWLKVSTLDGRQGYVNKNMIRSPTDYSACFLFTDKLGWKMISLVSNE